MDSQIIKAGDYIIVQRQEYTKLHKTKQRGAIKLGKDDVELDNILGHKFYKTFRMLLKPGTKRTYMLEESEMVVSNQLNVEQSGADNRNIIDDGSSQGLTKEQIEELREQSLSSSTIVEKLIENSKTFSSKTEYSQEKYLKKKEKKYFEFIQIRKPSIRLLAQMFYRQDPGKTLGIRIDDLSQILIYANIEANGNYLLYDSGTSGLLTASVLHAIGANTNGKLIHAHPGNECQKNAFLAMQFPKEQQERCVHVNLYSVLRCFYQNKESFTAVKATPEGEIQDETTPDENGTNEVDNSLRKRKLVGEVDPSEPPLKKPCWQFDNEKACKILEAQVDGIIVVAKEHPESIVAELIPFLNQSRSIVVFSLLKEPLHDLYSYLKKQLNFINIKLTNNFMRNYQVLPERTHPEISMNSGGYILTACKVKA